MKRFLLLVLMIVPMFLSSCQCSEKPEIGPVEGESMLLIGEDGGLA